MDDIQCRYRVLPCADVGLRRPQPISGKSSTLLQGVEREIENEPVPELVLPSREDTPSITSYSGCHNGHATSDRSSIAPSSTADLRSTWPSTSPSCTSRTSGLGRRSIDQQRSTTSQVAFDDESSDETQPPQRSRGPSGTDKQRKKRKYCDVKNSGSSNEIFERIVETFGAKGNLVHFEQVVFDAKESLRWASTAWPPRNLMNPNIHFIEYFQAVPGLVEVLEDHGCAERLRLVQNRMARAHFYQAYQFAKDHYSVFISWTETEGKNKGIQLTPCTGHKQVTVIKQRFIDISIGKSRRNRKELSIDINNWQSWGWPWARLIDRLGFGGLLLIPERMTND